MVVAQKTRMPSLLALTALLAPAYSLAALLPTPEFAPRNISRLLASPWTSPEAQTLSAAVGGRLYPAVPFEKSCFSIYEGDSVSTDPAACSLLQSRYTDPTFRVTKFGAYMLPQWETCQSSTSISGCLLDSADPTNPAAWNGINCQLGNIPSYYIDVRSASDVQAAYEFAKSTGVRLSVKNAGHDYKGRSSGKNTLSLWTVNLKSLSNDAAFTPEGCTGQTYDTITTGAGVSTQAVYEYADSIDRTIMGGYHATIGFSGGYMLGGGHSILSPVYGLAVDRVVQVKIVTPDGEYRTANECQNQDLFFAVRGGGGSAFGVVIESTHRVEGRITLQVASLRFTPSSRADLAAWYKLGVDNSLQWANDGWGGHFVGPTLIHVTPLLNNAEAQASMQAAADFVLARNGSAVIEELPSWLAFFNKYVPAAQAAVGAELSLGTRLIPSQFFSTAAGRDALATVIEEALPFASPYIIAGTPWLYAEEPGATSVTPAWRDAIWLMSVKWEFHFDDTLAEREAGYAALGEQVQKFRDMTPGSGTYFNEGDVYEPEHEQSFWGNNYAELLTIKQKYDPLGLLNCWQCVGWNGPDDELFQCYVQQ